MKVKEYEDFVRSQAFIPLENEAYSVIGLCGESGEVAEWYKKAVIRGNPKYTEDMLKLELSDVLHYICRIALNHEWTLKELMEANKVKLEERTLKI